MDNNQGNQHETEYPSMWENSMQDMLPEVLLEMATKNAADVGNAKNGNQGHFKQGIAAEIIFVMSDHCRLDSHAKFLALELFDMFMQKHIQGLHYSVFSEDIPSVKRDSHWTSMQGMIQSQMYLRMMACLMVASKFDSTRNGISVPRAKDVLDLLGVHYPTEIITESEQLALVTLEFRVAIKTTYDYVERFLEGLNIFDATLPLTSYLSMSVDLLTVVHLKYKEIVKDVASQCSRYRNTSSEVAMKELQADKMLAAVGVIATAVYISDGKNSDLVNQQLQRMSQVSGEDMDIFVGSLMHIVDPPPRSTHQWMIQRRLIGSPSSVDADSEAIGHY